MRRGSHKLLRLSVALIVSWGLLGGTVPSASAARIKDIATIQGMTKAQLFGYGLVVGLNGTGDRTTSVGVTQQSLENVLRNMGITVDDPRTQLRTENVASVLVTAEVSSFLRAGSRVDVLVSAIGDARSLEGGTLLLTNLMDVNGNVVATAQGPVATGGVLVEAAGSRFRRNYVATGRVPNGAQLLQSVGDPTITVPDPAAADPTNAPEVLLYGLRHPDFTTAARMAAVINAQLGAGTALALDAATVRVVVPSGADLVSFISNLEALEVTPDQRAKVVVDERTGTVVIGQNVRISSIAVTHQNLSVQVVTRPIISQPAPFSGGRTVVVPEAEITVTQPGPALTEGGPMQLLPEGTTLNELVQGLNALGVAPRDLITILQLIKEAGALQAELEIR
ncbi:MAG: flagellar P-ring protein 1 [Candidatus Poribacteria bacterium]|nr:MAG: flagellar P-ring protein 1 [Candidatus Poribacteria bacterium]